jgi:hypothetical protein
MFCIYATTAPRLSKSCGFPTLAQFQGFEHGESAGKIPARRPDGIYASSLACRALLAGRRY